MIPLTLLTAIVQQPTPVPPETSEFAFWIGEWNCEGLSYNLQDPKQTTKTTATNHITSDLGGHVIHEHFSMPGFNGESWSVYNPASKKWHQTWVDDSGAYIALEGAWSNGKMTLMTLQNPAHPKAFSRMVYSNITKDSFDWNWEASRDSGTTWTLNWHLHYTRKS